MRVLTKKQCRGLGVKYETDFSLGYKLRRKKYFYFKNISLVSRTLLNIKQFNIKQFGIGQMIILVHF